MLSADFRPRALVFDMDGLLVDSEPLWFEVERDFARSFGATWDHAHAATSKGVGIASTVRKMRSLFGFECDVEEAANSIVEAFIARVHELSLKPGAAELLQAARSRIPVALASSSCRRLIDATLSRFELTAAFDATVSGDDVAQLKPAPDIFLLAAERLRVPPSTCLAFEDSLSGAESAHRAGMQVVAVPEQHPPNPRFYEIAHVVLPSLVHALHLIGPVGGAARES